MTSRPVPEGDAWLTQPAAGRIGGYTDQAIGYWRRKGMLADDEWYEEDGRYFVLQSAVVREIRKRGRVLLGMGGAQPDSAADPLGLFDLKELARQLGAVTVERDRLQAENRRLKKLGAAASRAVSDLNRAMAEYMGDQ